MRSSPEPAAQPPGGGLLPGRGVGQHVVAHDLAVPVDAAAPNACCASTPPAPPWSTKPPRRMRSSAASGSSSSVGAHMPGSMPRTMLRRCSLPVVGTDGERGAHVRAAAEHADGAVRRAEAVVGLEAPATGWPPRSRRSKAVVREAVALGAHVGEPGLRAALQVLRQQAVGAADRGVGVVVGAHRAEPGVHPDLGADRPVDDDHVVHRRRAGAARAHAAGGECEDDREVLGPGAGHHGVHRDLLDRVLPRLAGVGRPHPADDLVAARGWCRRASPSTRSSVGSTIGR